MKPKDQGTAWQRQIIALAKAHGCQAWPLAEQGTKDAGDIGILTPDGDFYIVEAKNRQALNIHDAYAKALEKAENADLPFPVAGVVVAWKRLHKLSEGAQRRSQAGPPVFAVSGSEWFELITR